MKNINNTIMTKGITVLLGFLTIVVAFLVVPQFTVASAACDRDATCRDRNGNDAGDKRFCRNPGNNGECVACLNGNSSQCPANHTCSGGACIPNPPTATPIPPTATPTATPIPPTATPTTPVVTVPPVTVAPEPGSVVIKTDANGVATISFKRNETSVAAFESAIEAKFAVEGIYTASACTAKVTYTPAPPELTLTANPDKVNSGDSSTLTWTTKNVTTCTASEGWTGTKTATGGTESTGPLTIQKSYTLTCTGPGGEITKTATINVNQAAATTLNFSLLLHGMGAAGDNVVPQPAPCKRTNGQIANPDGCLSNQAPLRPQRDITVEILNQSNQVAATVSGQITYDNSTGTFKGSADLGSNWTSGVYNIKVLSPQYLRRQIPGFHTITSKEAYSVPVSNLVSSDVDEDNRLTILDYNMIITCYTFIGDPATCQQAEAQEVDVNDDGDNDEFDENLFRRDLIVQYGQ